ncbi:MAG TPA: hypothetical protein VFX39_04465, partial [Gemmatimonadaceae bacterium]|nr:hypothetical protein [Gemmatimonadaceae bacterium]
MPQRWSACLAGALALVALAGTPACAFQDGGSPDARRRAATAAALEGRYDEAARIYEGLVGDASSAAAARASDARALARVLVEAGRSEDAAALAGRWSADSALLAAAAVALGDAHRSRGRLDEAERLYELAARASSDSLAARL